MSKRLRVDMVSDVVCPWCAVGLYSLLQAQEVFEDVALDLHFQPFELSPDLPKEEELVRPHLMKKYGMTSEQVLNNQQQITARGKEVGFDFDFNPTSMKWNTLDAHRLLHWAQVLGEEGQALKLKQALLVATFSENQNIADVNVLAGVAEKVGLDFEATLALLASDRYLDEVKQQELHWQQLGIQSVPAFVFEQQYLVSGGQTPERFREVIAKLVSEQKD
jgi:predicted DsbA family dithiol-disulfide isomerase